MGEEKKNTKGLRHTEKREKRAGGLRREALDKKMINRLDGRENEIWMLDRSGSGKKKTLRG